MPLKVYLDKRQNKHGESPIRLVWSFNGDRYQTTMGFSVRPRAWDDEAKRVTPAEYNHKKTASTTINAFIDAAEKAVNRVENYARTQNATLAKAIVKKVVSDVLGAGGEYPYEKEKEWKKLVGDRMLARDRYFEHYKGGKYRLVGFGKDSDTLEDVVIYQALYGVGQIWVRPSEAFFGTVTDEEGVEVKRYREITI